MTKKVGNVLVRTLGSDHAELRLVHVSKEAHRRQSHTASQQHGPRVDCAATAVPCQWAQVVAWPCPNPTPSTPSLFFIAPSPILPTLQGLQHGASGGCTRAGGAGPRPARRAGRHGGHPAAGGRHLRQPLLRAVPRIARRRRERAPPRTSTLLLKVQEESATSEVAWLDLNAVQHEFGNE